MSRLVFVKHNPVLVKAFLMVIFVGNRVGHRIQRVAAAYKLCMFPKGIEITHFRLALTENEKALPKRPVPVAPQPLRFSICVLLPCHLLSIRCSYPNCPKRYTAILTLDIIRLNGFLVSRLALSCFVLRNRIKMGGAKPVLFSDPNLIAAQEACVHQVRIVGSKNELSPVCVDPLVLKQLDQLLHQIRMQFCVHFVDKQHASVF